MLNSILILLKRKWKIYTLVLVLFSILLFIYLYFFKNQKNDNLLVDNVSLSLQDTQKKMNKVHLHYSLNEQNNLLIVDFFYDEELKNINFLKKQVFDISSQKVIKQYFQNGLIQVFDISTGNINQQQLPNGRIHLIYYNGKFVRLYDIQEKKFISKRDLKLQNVNEEIKKYIKKYEKNHSIIKEHYEEILTVLNQLKQNPTLSIQIINEFNKEKIENIELNDNLIKHSTEFKTQKDEMSSVSSKLKNEEFDMIRYNDDFSSDIEYTENKIEEINEKTDNLQNNDNNLSEQIEEINEKTDNLQNNDNNLPEQSEKSSILNDYADYSKSDHIEFSDNIEEFPSDIDANSRKLSVFKRNRFKRLKLRGRVGLLFSILSNFF
ncbi:hypothetical protein AXA84_0363 [Candidatus Phytoplasma oryzae]|uniref:Uncharacterized protein n=1 Tax=Candidatus Phytoplasma oryzae TaxID=203274 RepID=A0A139JQ82_9MOLU|nr:hypothetical protein [Candidatus Phytoplasma oryzae]KXT29127.1 hypothetical protein AXA84_0363 [Candidatus Phytoplasma oryzae]RAM57555.1 hypothetical protein DH96_02435 [Candidatus Phytoplasma oryzae]